MLNFEETINDIEKKKVRDITTKELKAYGFSSYYIQKAIDMGKLLRSERGKYTVIKTRDRNLIFDRFVSAVFKSDFEEAYHKLIMNVSLQVDHAYDNHLYIYALLLKEILKDKDYDFSFMDDLWQYSGVSSFDLGNHIYLKKFEEAVMASKFNDALSYISTYKKLGISNSGKNYISTNVFQHLVSAAIYQKRNEQKKLQEQLIKSKNSQMYWRKYRFHLKNNDYKETIEDLKNIKLYEDNSNIPKWIDLLNICIHMEEELTIILDQNEDYGNLDDLQKLSKSIENKDYIMAWKFVLICIQKNPNSNDLKKYRDLLQKIMQLNTKNIKQKEQEEPMEELNISQEITVDSLADFIYNKEYGKVREFLENYPQNMVDNRTYAYILKLIKGLSQIHQLKLPSEMSEIQYTTSESDIFKHFFEALRFQDYNEAYQYAVLCEERNLIARPNDVEFTLYRFILEDIIEAIEIAEKQLEAKKQLQILNEKLNYIVYETNITEQLENLKELLQEKAEWNTSEQVIMYETYALDILDTIEIAKENRLDESYFETYDSQSNQLSTKFLKAIQNGDYVTAYQIITNKNWIDQTKTIENKKYFVLYKKLLSLLNNELNRKEKVIFEEKHEESNHIVDVLEEIWQLTKKYQYKEAYVVSQENALEMSDSLRIVLDTYLPLLQTILSKEIHLYLNQYEENMRRGNFDIATKSLMEYQEFVKRLGLNYELDYYFARLESMQKEANSDCFVQKERLYDYGFYCFEQCEYEKCIEIMNQYIELDHDFSAKGYMLRAEAYRVLDSLEASKKDYEKAISIIPEPTAFQKLGMINIQTGDYELALSNFLEYEKRCPNQSLDNLTFISNSYQHLKDTENQKKYELRIQCFNQQEWMKW